jgi:ABC-type transport system involved in multi-copper enzyme maturation permease subunit
MKKVYLLLFFICCLFVSSLNATSNLSYIECADAEEEIKLQGDLSGTSVQRSLIPTIQAFKDEYAVEVNLLSNLGIIAIYLYDETGGIVYQQSVNTSATQQVFIDITALNSGVYTLRFVNSQNQYKQGDFEI